MSVLLSERPFPSQHHSFPIFKEEVHTYVVFKLGPLEVGLEDQNEQVLGSCHLLLWVSHPGSPRNFEVAGSASVLPSSGCREALSESSEGPFGSLAHVGQPLWTENRHLSLLLHLGFLHPSPAPAEARASPLRLPQQQPFPTRADT